MFERELKHHADVSLVMSFFSFDCNNLNYFTAFFQTPVPALTCVGTVILSVLHGPLVTNLDAVYAVEIGVCVYNILYIMYWC